MKMAVSAAVSARMIWIPAAFFMFVLFPVGCKQDKNTYTPSPPPVVTVSNPEQREVIDYEEVTGTTEAYEFVEIRARVEGYLEGIHFTASSYVQKGDLLFTIDPRTYEAELKQAEAALLIKKAELNLARTTLKRKESAFKDRAVSEVEVLEARANVEQAEASIKAAEAEVDAAGLQLAYTKILAPISGRIGRSLVDSGNLVGAAGDATLLTTLVNDEKIYAYFSMNERDLLDHMEKRREQSSENQKARKGVIYLGLYNEKGYPHQGRMDYIENRLDPETGTIQFRAVFPNPEKILLSGLFARLRIPTGKPKNALLVPNSALSIDQRGRYLLVLGEQNKVEYRSVQVGSVTDGMRVIVSGISAEDRVIVNGIQRARPGIQVNPKTSDSH